MVSVLNLALGCFLCKPEEVEDEVSLRELQMGDDKSKKLKMDETVTNYYVKLNGLARKTTQDDVAKFLVDCEIIGNVVIINNENGRPSGEAVVKLENKVDFERALKCNGKDLHNRFIDIEETDAETFNRHNDKKKKTDTEENAFIRLRGLVWTAKEEDIKTFLHDCKVKKVVITTNERGKPSGDAFVQLESKVDVEKAKAHNREYLRERFVIVEEIHESQYIRETQAVNKTTPTKINLQSTSTKRNIQTFLKDETSYFIKLSGLPWKATEEEIAKFLVDCYIVGDVVIINNEYGKPSGDAVVKLKTKVDLEKALKCNRNHLHGRFVIVEESDSESYNRHVKKEKTDAEKNAFMRLRGLVWNATEEDIKKFLHDCKVKKVVITTNEHGKPSGDAFVHLESEADVEKARAHDREYLRDRFVIVEEIYEAQFLKETQLVDESKQKRNKEYSTSHLKLSNLPLTCSDLNIVAFLKDCQIKQITILKNKSGKPIGESIVEVESNDDLVRGLICNNSSLQGRVISVDKAEKFEVSEVATAAISTAQEMEVCKSKKRKMDETVTNYFIKLSGLPWKATEDEIAKFLVDCEIVGNVVIINNDKGRPSGDAVVKLLNKVDLEKSLKCNRKHLHGRFVVIEETDDKTYNKHIVKLEKTNTEENALIYLKGLVWSATEEDIKNFLHDCKVKKVVLTTNEEGKPTGDAVVHLDSKSDVKKARAHNKEYLKERFVIVE